MTLQSKFGVLVGLLALTALVSLAAAAWSVSFIQRETDRAFDGAADVLTHLRAVQSEIDALADAPNADGLQEILARFDRARADLFAIPALQRRGGVSTTRALASSLDEVHAGADAWIDTPADESRRRMRDAIDTATGIASIIEREILRDARDAARHGDTLRASVFRILALALVSALLISLLALILVRRWVVRPVAALRRATSRIAAGDFAHRLPVHGEDELARLSAEVNHMSETIVTMQDERVQRERLAATGEMVRRLAHNIRNPLAGIRSLAELTRDDSDQHSPIHENQERIVQSVDRFEGWLAELLESTSPLELQPGRHEVRPWMESIAAALNAHAAGQGVELTINSDPAPDMARFDPRHLEHAVVAIAGNAIEAAGSGGTVRIEVAGAANAREWTIDISDSGPGIPEDLIGSIFTAHFTTKPNGNGIGLAVAHQVVKEHGGRIVVAPTMQVRDPAEKCAKGAHFSVVLPLDGTTTVAESGSG